jgi:hypothetical protein
MIQTKQTNLNIFYNFNISDSFENTPESLNTSTQGTNFTFNPSYSCRCRRGYSLFSDPFNEWRPQIETDDYSRKDIAFSHRLGGGF